MGQVDLYNQTVSDAIAEMAEMPVALMKIANKNESSGIQIPVGHGMGQAQRSLVVG